MKKNTAQKRMGRIKQGRMLIVSELYKKGWSMQRIADEVKARMNTTCSTRTVYNDIQDLLKEWRETRIQDTDDRLQLELERIDDCIAELWNQWEKSKENWLKEYNKRVGVPGGSDESNSGKIQTIKLENYQEEQVGLGNTAYIAEIRQQLIERRKLLGLYAATKTEVTGKDGSPLLPVQKMTEEEIKAEIDRINKSRNS
ncbi:MAG: hypothetical protein ACI3ZZ_01770 [Candidatus Aphodosoma sp.]